MADCKHITRASTRIPLADEWNRVAGELLLAMLTVQEAQKRLASALAKRGVLTSGVKS
jgi:hypothetical protein